MSKFKWWRKLTGKNWYKTHFFCYIANIFGNPYGVGWHTKWFKKDPHKIQKSKETIYVYYDEWKRYVGVLINNITILKEEHY